MSKSSLFARLPLLNLSRKLGRPLCMPVSFTFSVNTECDCRCRTCNIYSQPNNHMSFDEWVRVCGSIGRAPYWITVTGGNQFLRPDFLDLLKLYVDKCRPSILNIPVNGTMPERIHDVISNLCRFVEGYGTAVNVNLSIDGVGEGHDEIKNKKGNFENLMKTHKLLSGIKSDYLRIGFYTVVSKFNMQALDALHEHIKHTGATYWGLEPAENRVELGNMETELHEDLPIGLSRFSADFAYNLRSKLRSNYHRLAEKSITDNTEIIPCYAGYASVHISHDGQVWQCVTKAESMGSLLEQDFKSIWKSNRARQIRSAIKKSRCYCTNSNPGLTNQLCSPGQYFRLL